MLRLTWINGSHCLTYVSLYLWLASSYQIKTKLFIVLLEEMIGQFCWHVRIHCLNIYQWHQYVYALFVPAPFEWQGPAQTTPAWGYRRGRKVQTGFWSAAQTWSEYKCIWDFSWSIKRWWERAGRYSIVLSGLDNVLFSAGWQGSLKVPKMEFFIKLIFEVWVFL